MFVGGMSSVFSENKYHSLIYRMRLKRYDFLYYFSYNILTGGGSGVDNAGMSLVYIATKTVGYLG